MSKNVQAESNVRQACLNGIAEAQPLFCKEHFISCFVFCSFVLPHNADELGAFVEVERINHVGAAVRPADGVVGGDAQDACCLVHLEVHTAQVLVIAAERQSGSLQLNCAIFPFTVIRHMTGTSPFFFGALRFK